MLSKVLSSTVNGLKGVLIEVEVDVAGKGFPTFTIVGLPNKSIEEAKDRVRTAIVNASFEMPDSRLTVNLAPADLPKIGSGFDLPIAVGILASSGCIEKESLVNSLFIGELSLEGKLKPVPGAISFVLMAREKGIKNIFLPVDNAIETSFLDGVTIFPVESLTQLVLHLTKHQLIQPQSTLDLKDRLEESTFEFDMADVKGQEQAKRAMQIAAAGLHNLHMKGPPGAGKTMLSRSFPSILPIMQSKEVLEVMQIYSLVGSLKNTITVRRPFRSPHHTTSRIGLIGGGSEPVPGEISLAHNGVLFLDELPEFPRIVLEALRQPLEDHIVTISRAAGTVTFPAKFLLLAASNPCPCGFLGHPQKRCSCLSSTVVRYQKKLSGPLLDRIDLHINVAPVEKEKLQLESASVTSKDMQLKVIDAYGRQLKRFKDTEINTNSQMQSSHIKYFCRFSSAADSLLKQAIVRLSLSARSYFKVIRVAQTITDLDGKESIETSAIAEALQYRVKDG